MQVKQWYELLAETLNKRKYMNETEKKQLNKIVEFAIEEGIIVNTSRSRG
jgi:hypothetical protein